MLLENFDIILVDTTSHAPGLARALRLTGTHRVECGDRGAGRGRASQRHVDAVAACAERILDLDRDRRVHPLQVRRAEHDEVDILAGAAGHPERELGDGHRVLGLDAQPVLAAVGDVRAQPLGVGQPGLVLDVALLDPARLLDELRRRLLERDVRAGGDLGGVTRVIAPNELVEGLAQLGVGERVRGVPDTPAGDRGLNRTRRRP
jgi:hypothetical protein